MANPPLKQDFVDGSTPLPNQLSAVEYNRNALRTDEAWDYTQSGTAVGEMVRTATDEAAARTAMAAVGKGELVVNVKDYGAVGDGVADDTAAINSALTFVGSNGGGTVLLSRNHALTDTLVIPELTTLRGRGGHSNSLGTKLTSSATSGPMIQMLQRSARLEQVRLTATSGRRSASTATGHGVFIGGTDVSSGYPSLSRLGMFDVDIRDQPTDGLHCIGSMEFSRFQQVTVSDCVRHGYVFSRGQIAGWSNLQIAPFMLTLETCRAIECGGQALICLSEGGVAPQGVRLENFEALGCAWDSTKRNTIGADSNTALFQIQLGGRGHIINRPDIEDQQYANTATATGGHPRTALATPSKGVYCLATGVQVSIPYFSSLVQSWLQAPNANGLGITWPLIVAGNYGVNQSPAIQIPTTALGIDIRYATAMTSGATVAVQNQSINARIEENGIPRVGLSTTVINGWSDGLTPADATIASSVLTISSRRTKVAGEGAAADSFHNMRLAPGVNGVTGMDIWLFRGAEDITIVHGTGDIRNSSGANIVMTATTNTVLHYVFDGTNWVQDTTNGVRNTAALDFGSVAAQSFTDLTIPVTGAVLGDSVALGVPVEAITAGIVYSAWVSAANTVTVRAHNYSAAAADPASGTFKASIVR